MMIGVLALQGSFLEHKRILDTLGVSSLYVRTHLDLAKVDALILPGGESTTIAKLLNRNGLDVAIRERIASGMPVYGTCAGMILLAKNIDYGLQLLDIDVQRNGYGRQNHSTIAAVSIESLTDDIQGCFIRAPRITRVGEHVEILGTLEDEPVLVKQDAMLASSFHPELTGETFIHSMFLSLIR